MLSAPVVVETPLPSELGFRAGQGASGGVLSAAAWRLASALIAGVLCLGLFGVGSSSAKAQLAVEVGYLGHRFERWENLDLFEGDLRFEYPVHATITHGGYGFLGYRFGGEFSGFSLTPEVFLSSGIGDYKPKVGDNPLGINAEDVSMHPAFKADVLNYGGGLRVGYKLDVGLSLYAQVGYAKLGFNPNLDFGPLTGTVDGEPKDWDLYYALGMSFNDINVALMKFTQYGPLTGANKYQFIGLSLRVGYAFQIRLGGR